MSDRKRRMRYVILNVDFWLYTILAAAAGLALLLIALPIKPRRRPRR